MFKLLRSLPLFLPVCLVALSLLMEAQAQDSPLAIREVQARQLAIRILQNIQPIEDLIETRAIVRPTPASVKRYVEITGSRVNLRAEPSTDSEISGVGQEGELYEYIRTEGEWHLIKMDAERQAYVSSQFSRLAPEGESRPSAAAPSETLPVKFQDRARRILGENKRAIETLKQIADQSQADFDSRYKGKNLPSDDPELWAATASLMKIHKYERGVVGQYDRFAGLVGGEIPDVQAAPEWSRNVRGTAAAGFGSNTARSETGGVENSKTDVTRSDISADLSVELTPSDRLGINAGRSEEISFRPIARTHAGLDYQRKFGDRATVFSSVGLKKLEDGNDDTNDIDQTDFAVQARVKTSEFLNANAGIGFSNASYPNNDDLDYADTRFGFGLNGQIGQRTGWGAKFSQAVHDVDLSASADDNTQRRIEGILSFNSGEHTSLEISAHTEDYEFDQSADPRTYSRRGIKLALRKRGEPGNSSGASFEIRRKSHDINDDRNYTDIRGELRADALDSDGPKSASRFMVNYRSFKGNGIQGFLDYLESRFDVSRQPGNGFFWESNLYGQYYFENNNVKKDALVTQFAWLGLVLGSEGAFKVGPHIATNTILVTTDTPDQGTFEHPNNTFRYGAKAAVDVRSRPLRIHGSGRYELLKYYNLDNAATPSRLELEGEGIYQIARRIDASAKLKYYATGSDDPGAIETSEFDILFGLIYHIGGQP